MSNIYQIKTHQVREDYNLASQIKRSPKKFPVLAHKQRLRRSDRVLYRLLDIDKAVQLAQEKRQNLERLILGKPKIYGFDPGHDDRMDAMQYGFAVMRPEHTSIVGDIGA